MFAADGKFMYDDEGHSGLYGDVILVNGVPWPNAEGRAKRKYRFRILNASLSRGLRLQLSNSEPDAGHRHRRRPHARTRSTTVQLRVGMAERYEIVIDFAKYTPGTKIQLRNLGVPNSTDFDHTDKIMQFEVGQRPFDPTNNQVPARAQPQHGGHGARPKRRQGPSTKSSQAQSVHRSHSTMRTVNDANNVGTTSSVELPGRSSPNPELGEVQIWEITNKSGRLVPPGAHPPRRLQDAHAQRQARVQLRAGP